MFLSRNSKLQKIYSFLRASGGVSKSFMIYIEVDKFSPRKRRCFYLLVSRLPASKVFSAQAEVFPVSIPRSRCVARFLRASGGVSTGTNPITGLPGFSPRKRRCFFRAWLSCYLDYVFSAQAEVFPRQREA